MYNIIVNLRKDKNITTGENYGHPAQKIFKINSPGNP
jgi:hypothetical protein